MQGQCLCGKVQFSVQAPSKWCAHCHCTMCQRAHGAAFVTWLGVESKQFHLVSGQDNLQWHNSSKDAQRGFCRECGSTLFFQSQQWPGEIHIARANMTGEIDREPAAHAYFETHVPWLEVNDALKKLTS